MVKFHVLLIFFWLGYCVLHSVLANEGIKARIRILSKTNEKLYRVFYNVFALVTLIALLWFQFSSASTVLFQVPIINKIIAPVLGIFGLAGMVICIKKYFMQ
ncbi:MAG: hypothetical protein ABIO05_08725, partial [Ferruginibacter sp.]